MKRSIVKFPKVVSTNTDIIGCVCACTCVCRTVHTTVYLYIPPTVSQYYVSVMSRPSSSGGGGGGVQRIDPECERSLETLRRCGWDAVFQRTGGVKGAEIQFGQLYKACYTVE